MAKKRNLYLTSVPLSQAMDEYVNRMAGILNRRETEWIDVGDALGRMTAAPVFAKLSAPHYNASAMDGISVLASTTYTASETTPVQLKKNRDYIVLNTGAPLPDEYDAVIMIEDVVEIDDETVEIRSTATPWQHVRPVGEDIVKGELVLPVRHIIRPQDMGALLSGGVTQVSVYRRIQVGLIPTGSEITDITDPLPPGKIIESNSKMFRGLIETYGGRTTAYPIVQDDPDLLKAAVLKGVRENDVLVINAGSSAGTKDFTVDVLRELGTVVFHGIAIKPGKPAILAEVKGKPVVGIPGYPVSAYVVFEQIVKPLVYHYQYQKPPGSVMIEAVLARRVVSSLKHEEHIRIKVGRVGDRWIATPLSRGAGVTMSLVRADGMLTVPQEVEGYEKGSLVPIRLARPMDEIQNTLVSIGSHDLVMDLLANELQHRGSGVALSSAHTGSMGGVIAMRQGECHMAPVHLLDETTGTYNSSMVRAYFPQKTMALIKLVKRSQGLMLAPGNPKNIQGITDLTRTEVSMVNRQKGAGTRILLDYYLKREGIDGSQLNGYHREMTTHMAVAVAVKSGSADCGMGVASAASAMELNFLHLDWEDYDLLCDATMLETPLMQELLAVIRDPEFQEMVKDMGGYDLTEAGQVEIIAPDPQ
ncbi:MAG: molybdopterin biosynthesis protein [Bacillota bacterium]|nr:molybdopterin biosynthesis protein [Bacillota bacterium]MDW7677417.1 molybdopterin biosynthesis protein [Bacillota bacterium]